jgi:hypothetical protein
MKLPLSAAAKPTSVPTKYIPDGTGRDSFVVFTSNQQPPRSRFSMKMSKSNKVVVADPSPGPRFVPDGSGRDMFMQSNVQPATGVHIGGGMKASPIKKAQSTGSLLAKPLPSYVSNGKGRDAYVVGRTLSPPKSTSFKLKPPSKKPCARTDPPPRFRPTGTLLIILRTQRTHQYLTKSYISLQASAILLTVLTCTAGAAPSDPRTRAFAMVVLTCRNGRDSSTGRKEGTSERALSPTRRKMHTLLSCRR